MRRLGPVPGNRRVSRGPWNFSAKGREVGHIAGPIGGGATLRGVRPDFPLSAIELLPPLLSPEKILCIGINYANRNADFNDPDAPKYPSMFYRHPGSLVGSGQALVRPK